MASQSKNKLVDLPESRIIRNSAEDRALHVRRYRVTLNIPNRKTFQTVFVTRGPSRKGLSTQPYKPTALAPPAGVSTPSIVPTSEVLDNSTGSPLEVMQVGIVDADEPAKYGPRGQPSGNRRAQRDNDGNVLDKTVDVPIPARNYAAVTPREDVVRGYYKVYAAVPEALGQIQLYVINIDNVFIFSEFYYGIDLKKCRRDLTKLVGGNIRNAVARQNNAGDIDDGETTDDDDDDDSLDWKLTNSRKRAQNGDRSDQEAILQDFGHTVPRIDLTTDLGPMPTRDSRSLTSDNSKQDTPISTFRAVEAFYDVNAAFEEAHAKLLLQCLKAHNSSFPDSRIAVVIKMREDLMKVGELDSIPLPSLAAYLAGYQFSHEKWSRAFQLLQ